MQGETADSASLDKGQKLGRIQVKITRVFITKRSIPLPHSKSEFITVTDVSEKTLKGKAVSNTIGYIILLFIIITMLTQPAVWSKAFGARLPNRLGTCAFQFLG